MTTATLITMKDLCEALGGTNYEPEYQGGQFTLNGLLITARTGYGAKAGKLTLGSYAADRTLTQRVWKIGGAEVQFPKINVDPSRDLAAIVKDVQARLISKAAAPLAQLQEIDAVEVRRQEIAAGQAASLAHALPAYEITDNEQGRNINVRLRGTDQRPHFSGYFKANGELVVTSVGTLSPEKARAFLALLTA